jgi:hypothetical protein
MTWVFTHAGIAFVILMFLWGLADPRPRDDQMRRGKRYRQKRYWR